MTVEGDAIIPTDPIDDVVVGLQHTAPELIVEWVMLFPNGNRASAVLRSSDHVEAQQWAGTWGGETKLHRRIVMVGAWHPADQIVSIEAPEGPS